MKVLALPEGGGGVEGFWPCCARGGGERECGENFAGATCTNAASLPQADFATTTYDALGRPLIATAGDGGQTTITYSDDQANPPAQFSATTSSLIVSGTSKTSTALMDGLGNVVQTQASDPEGTDYVDTTYDAIGRKSTVSNPHRSATLATDGITTFNYDGLSRTTSVIEPDGSTASTAYAGNTVTATDETGKQRESVSDALGRLTQLFEDPGSSPHLNYETDYTYDALNNLIRVDQKGSAPTDSKQWRTRTFTYDSLSRLVCAANPEIQIATCPTSPAGPFPAGAITYAYDSDGNLITKTAPLPNQTGSSTVQTTNTYDALNRLTKKVYTDTYTPLVQYAYDGNTLTGCTTTPPGDTDSYPLGRRTSMCDGSGATSWTHDQMGRVAQERRRIGPTTAPGKYITYTYNKDGSLATLQTPPLKTVSYTVGGAGRATQLVDTGDSINFVTGATYAPPGELTGMTMGSASGFAGFTVHNAYNDRLQPILLSAASPTATVFSECFDYHLGVAITQPSPCSFSASTAGDNGNVYQVVNNRDNARNQNFMYDSLNRLQQAYSSGTQWGETFGPTATSPGVAPSAAGIDAWGNLTNRSGVIGKTSTASLSVSAGANNQLAGVGYDAAGNMTSNGSTSYVYDAENRMVWTSGYRYIYDGNGQRVEKCAAGTATTACPTSGTTGTLYWRGTGSDTLDESDLGGNPQEEYVFFNGQRVARRDVSSTGATIAVHYYFSDHLGSHGVVENATGTTCEQDMDYYPYGGVQHDYCPNVVQNYKFTGKERDAESGLDNFEARYYGSSLGRFMSPDPEQIDGFDHLSNPQSWNGYAYVHNNPLNATDPDGLDCIYIDNDSGKMTGFNRGDCDNSTEEKANSGYYVNGNVDTITENQQGQVTGFGGTGENGNLITGAFAPTPLDTSGQLNPTAQAIFSQPVLGNAAGTVDLLARIEYRTASFFFPFTGLLIDQVSGIDSGTSSGVTAAGVSRKPGALGQFKGTDALRRENRMARDIMKELKLGPEAREAVHEALSEGAQMAGRKLTYQEGVAAVKAVLGLL